MDCCTHGTHNESLEYHIALVAPPTTTTTTATVESGAFSLFLCHAVFLVECFQEIPPAAITDCRRSMYCTDTRIKPLSIHTVMRKLQIVEELASGCSLYLSFNMYKNMRWQKSVHVLAMPKLQTLHYG